MEGFTLIHNECGKEATLTYYQEDDWEWDGENENCIPINGLRINCKTCNVYVEPEPERY